MSDPVSTPADALDPVGRLTELADVVEGLVLSKQHSHVELALDVAEQAVADLRAVLRRLAVCEGGIKAVAALIAESRGVCGLHLNGDEAPWAELQSGGRYEEWLRDFDAAAAPARSEPVQIADIPRVAHHLHNIATMFKNPLPEMEAVLRRAIAESSPPLAGAGDGTVTEAMVEAAMDAGLSTWTTERVRFDGSVENVRKALRRILTAALRPDAGGAG